MKKTISIFVIIGLLVLALILWIMKTRTITYQDILMFGGLLVVVGFAVFIGINRIKSVIQKEPFEDELSKKIMTKASSISYYISIYLWLIIMYFSDKMTLESHSLIGAGILGMAIIFLLSWIGVKMFGVANG
jgi:peptidoglycan/LPS O-acetylase OafA/YrhL